MYPRQRSLLLDTLKEQRRLHFILGFGNNFSSKELEDRQFEDAKQIEHLEKGKGKLAQEISRIQAAGSKSLPHLAPDVHARLSEAADWSARFSLLASLTKHRLVRLSDLAELCESDTVLPPSPFQYFNPRLPNQTTKVGADR